MRDANQRFSQLVREIEERREPVVVTHRGRPVVRIVPEGGKRRLTDEQQRALDAFFADVHKRKVDLGGWRFNRDEIYEDALLHSGHDRPRRRSRLSKSK